MENNAPLKVVVADTSVILRSGLAAVLKRLPNLHVHPIEVSSVESLHNYIHLHTPDVLIVNPSFGGWFDVFSFKTESKQMDVKFVAFMCNVIDGNLLKDYDEVISVYDGAEVIAGKLESLLCTAVDEEEEKDSEQEMLSQREKEIITCVVKGMTNKAIADKLYLSIHTVITHRRNIARKLQIHSPAGLTIYAIVNKLVELQDVKDVL